MPRKIYIADELIALAEHIPEDDPALYACWCDPDTERGYNMKQTKSYAEYRAWERPPGWGAIILRLDDNTPIGCVGFVALNADLSIMLNPAFRGMGYGTRAFALGARYCAEAFGLERIYAGCYVDNLASLKMLERCGFMLDPEPVGGDEYHYLTGEKIMQLEFVKYMHKTGSHMYDSFCTIAKRINEVFSVKPLLYGSFGLQRLLQVDLYPDDIDVLLPKNCLEEDWPKLLQLMRSEGYTLIDEHEHTFQFGALKISFGLNDLDGYADIKLAEALAVEDGGASYTGLCLEQYLAVYKKFSKDPYRRRVTKKHRNDRKKVRMIKRALRLQGRQSCRPHFQKKGSRHANPPHHFR